MNLENIIEFKKPFKHWEFSNCLSSESMKEMQQQKYRQETELMMVQELQIIAVKASMENSGCSLQKKIVIIFQI